MTNVGEAAWSDINREASEVGLMGLVERVRAADVIQTLQWFDEWWALAAATEQERRVILLVVWGGTLIPRVHVEMDKWIARFRRFGFTSDLAGQLPPMHDLSVYRGAPSGSERGMSWTTSEKVAAGFAERYTVYGERPGLVWQATVQADAVLGLIYQRDEYEVVVDPAGLTMLPNMSDA